MIKDATPIATKPAKAPRFFKLRVTEIYRTTRDAIVVSLVPIGAGDFSFAPGQFLTFRRDFDGTEVRRSYSICSGSDDPVLQVGIKKVDGGAFSTWANEQLRVGMALDAMEPVGNFTHSTSDEVPKSYLGFAGGSGITPILAILKTALQRESKSRFTLVYANRSVSSIMFREELEDLKNLHLDRLTLIHILENDAQEVDLFVGRVDDKKCAALFATLIDTSDVDIAFICGPEPMMTPISAALQDNGLSDEQIKFELFSGGQLGQLAQGKHTSKSPDSSPTTATITVDGSSRTFSMDRDQSILDAAIDAKLDPPYACKAGVCSTCKCKVLSGEVEMVANHALEDHEVKSGYILSCQSFPRSETVVVDFDKR